jgi:type II secretory pathway predicted ATPase ExeA/phage tail protein X
MYLTFYGLSEKPFGQTPDPKFLYWNDAYRETIASLRYGIQERKGFITMIGEAGTGKTTLLRKLLDDLGPDVVSVFLFNPNATFEEILEYTLGELGIPAPAGRKLAMLQRLNEFLLAAFQEGKNTILLIDEAQDLETDVLESLRLLSNLETSKEKILQIVLSGQPELATRLAQPNLRQLKQRIAVRCRLEPLARHELPDYIAARLAVAGGRPDLFAPATLDPIWEFAHGIPRLVNAVCDNALLVGYALGRQTIDAAVIGEVVADLTKIDAPLELPEDRVAPAATVPPASHSKSGAPVAPAPPARTEPDPPIPAPTVAPPPPAARAPIAAAVRSSSPDAAPVHPPSRGAPRRAAGFVLSAGILLALAAVGAFAASRWDEIRPRVRALLAERGDDAADRVATAPVPRPAMPAPAPPTVPAGAVRSIPASPPAAQAVPAFPATEPAQSANATGPAAQAAPQERALLPAEPAADSGAAGASRPVAHGTGTAPAQIPAVVPSGRSAEPQEQAARTDDAPAGASATAPAADTIQVAALPPTARAVSQDLQPARRAPRGGKRVLVQRGDTLMNLAAREYGNATYTALDVVRSANPGIQDVDRIIAGSEIVFPDPGPVSRVTGNGDELTVLVGTTPALAQAQELQRLVGARYRLPADLEPIPVGDGRNLYRVSLRNIPDQAQARQIAESLGTILKDPS